MKRFMTGSAIAAVAALAAPAAFADVQVLGTVTKDKDVTITLDIEKNKTVNVEVVAAGTLESAAVASAFINASIDNNETDWADGSPPEGDALPQDIFIGDQLDFDWEKTAEIRRSINENTGITQVNQDAGNGANQGNVVAAALVFGDQESIAEAEAYASQRISNNTTRHAEGSENVLGLLTPDDPSDDQPADLTATIAGSINGNTGVTNVNQNVGNYNNQHNALALAVGDNAFVALSDAGLGQEISSNLVTDVNSLKRESIENSVNGNTGITTVNQSAGYFNNQATIISVASISSAVGLGGGGATQ